MVRSSTSTKILYVGVNNAFINVNTTTQHLMDEYGRVRVFHGVNVVYKIFPWHPLTDKFDPQNSLVQEDIDNMVAWGFNAVRFGAMWPGVEPERGVFNQTYLEVIYNMVNQLGSAGIHTIIDFHQDIINRRFCGEGIPDWAVVLPESTLSFPEPAVLHKYPVDNETLYPDLSLCLDKEFATYYFSDAVGATFQSLYDNAEGIQDEFLKYWQQLAKTFQNVSTVLGYEIINEPWGGNIYKYPELLVDLGHADRVNLMPLYQNVNEAIREIDQRHAIFYEKSLVDLYDSKFPAGTPGGIEYNDRQILSYHIYCGNVGGNPRHVGLCDSENKVFLDGAMTDLRRTGGGGFMTEFGAISNTTNAMDTITYMMNEADNYFQSWCYWQFKFYNDLTTSGPTESLYLADGSLDVIKVRTLSRTYAQAIAGSPQKMTFDIQTASFTFSYEIDTSITQPTIIYLNEAMHYPNGYTASITTGSAQISSPSTNTINITPTTSTLNGQLITIEILAK
ncbi:hypothetical protein PPL_01061 [Heterostelium album PN500]|uniref:Endoglycoceramidase n=1 Tax=Heterostelium pallidum (strain ATCC 26659 / Pp 5 / PN500) TaxID=670386 RepID=D3AY03_HETP5|nr:hypothetical protein PPL_01061 [Heterostelium album PN500]EFA85830.1 hypothetical protein PPL_01061 [Heterostelium album PN500]|eukprot:XP_020437936.1 hypothetical protein PPL_01061 [Heterostelium album PN500]